MSFDKEKFFEVNRAKSAPFPLPGHQHLSMFQISGTDMQDYIDFMAAGNNRTAGLAFMVVRSVLHDGNRVFDDSDIARIAALPNPVLQQLVDVVNELHGWGAGAPEKNSPAGLAGDSSSDSA